jgi:uncharacterized protein with GYD domain
MAHVEADSDEAMARFALPVGSQGNVRSGTAHSAGRDSPIGSA